MELKPQFPKLDVNLARLANLPKPIPDILKGIFRDIFRILENLHTITCKVVNTNTAAPVWTPITLEANWANYGGTYYDAAWAMDERGIITLRGLIEHTGTGVGTYAFLWANNAGMLEPVGSKVKIFTSYGTTGIQRVDVATTGVALIAGDASAYLSLDGLFWETR